MEDEEQHVSNSEKIGTGSDTYIAYRSRKKSIEVSIQHNITT